MTDRTVCRLEGCPCKDPLLEWPDWAAPSTEWRPIENVKVANNRL